MLGETSKEMLDEIHRKTALGRHWDRFWEKERIRKVLIRAVKEGVTPCEYLSVTENFFFYCSHRMNKGLNVPSGPISGDEADSFYCTEGDMHYCLFGPVECYRNKNITVFLDDNETNHFIPLKEHEKEYIEKHCKQPTFPQESPECWKDFEVACESDENEEYDTEVDIRRYIDRLRKG